MKAFNLTRAALICIAASCAAGITACSDTSPPAPTETAAARRVAVRNSSYRKLVLRPVTANGAAQSGTMVVYLRPVMKGEPIPLVHD
jgi:hypothetical protein